MRCPVPPKAIAPNDRLLLSLTIGRQAGRLVQRAGRARGHEAELAAVLHRDEQVAAAPHGLRRMVAELIAEAPAAASGLPSQAAVRRLAAVTLAGMRR